MEYEYEKKHGSHSNWSVKLEENQNGILAPTFVDSRLIQISKCSANALGIDYSYCTYLYKQIVNLERAREREREGETETEVDIDANLDID